MKLTIRKKVEKPFKGDDGEERGYFWYTAIAEDGFALSFGSSDGGHEVGDKGDFLLEKYDRRDGKPGFREVL